MHLLGLLRGRCSPPIVRRLLGALFLLGAAGVLAAGSFSAGASPGDHQGPPGSVSSSSAPVWVEPRPTASEPEVAAPESVAAAIALPTVAPTAVPSAPTVLPTAVVPDLKASPPPPDPQLPAWASNTKDTSLWSGPTGGNEFTKVPAGATFRVMERQAGRFRVYYPGDRQKRAPGEAWVDAADLAPAGWPHWVRLRQSGRILAGPAGDASPRRRAQWATEKAA